MQKEQTIIQYIVLKVFMYVFYLFIFIGVTQNIVLKISKVWNIKDFLNFSRLWSPSSYPSNIKMKVNKKQKFTTDHH